MDTLGLVWGLAVLPAGVQDWDGAKALLGRLPALPRLAVIWADGAYAAVVDWVHEHADLIAQAQTWRRGG